MKKAIKDVKMRRAIIDREWLAPRVESVLETVDYERMNEVMGYYNIIKITKSGVMEEPIIAVSEEMSEVGSLEPQELRKKFSEKRRFATH